VSRLKFGCAFLVFLGIALAVCYFAPSLATGVGGVVLTLVAGGLSLLPLNRASERRDEINKEVGAWTERQRQDAEVRTRLKLDAEEALKREQELAAEENAWKAKVDRLSAEAEAARKDLQETRDAHKADTYLPAASRDERLRRLRERLGKRTDGK
jgi:hypothetical protein